MSDEFESVLKKLKWPDPTVELTQEWSDSFGKLLDLQAPEIIAAREPLVLLPMSVLAKSFILQFRYHFFSDKPTNHPHQVRGFLEVDRTRLTGHSLAIISLNGFLEQSQSGRTFFERTLGLFWPPISEAISWPAIPCTWIR